MQISQNTNYSNTEIQNAKLKKYNLQKCRNTNDRITEIQVTFEIRVSFELWMTFELWVSFEL